MSARFLSIVYAAANRSFLESCSAPIICIWADSPAIDHGQTLAKVTEFGHGNQRPGGRAYDMGAFEFQSAPIMQLAAQIRLRVIE